MASVLTWPEIFLLLTAGLLLGGSIGVVTGLIINKVLSSFQLPLKASVLLGIGGYWAGAYLSSAIGRASASNRAVVNLSLLAALAGSAAMTLIGGLGLSRLRGMLYHQARSEK